MRVHELVDAAELDALHAELPGWFDVSVQCAVGVFWPSRGQLERGELALVAELDGRPVGLVLARGDGEIDWCLIRPGQVPEAFPALMRALIERTGAARGRVESAELRAAYIAAAGEHAGQDPDDPARIWWGP